MLKVRMKPEEVWDYFQKNKLRLRNELDILAMSKNADVVVYITNEGGYPHFSVEREYKDTVQSILEKDFAISKEDCTEVSEEIFRVATVYAAELEANNEDEDDDDFEYMKEDVMERETNLITAFEDFLLYAMGTEDREFEGHYDLLDSDFVGELFHKFEMLCISEGVDIYHPEIFVDEDGFESIVGY